MTDVEERRGKERKGEERRGKERKETAVDDDGSPSKTDGSAYSPGGSAHRGYQKHVIHPSPVYV